METEKVVLGLMDYLVFTLMLATSAAIGVYFRFAGGKQKTTEEYLLAGKDMAIAPVAFSLMASFLSAITLIGVPAEVYRFGIYMIYLNIGYPIGMFLSSYTLLPVFFDMQASTAYEYLERRFGKVLRCLTSLAFMAQMILFTSVVLYAPALSLSAVTNLSTWISTISVGVVCIFYCTLGGMKAVLWTDVFQAVLMYLCIFAILIQGCLQLGPAEIFRIAGKGDRLAVPSVSWNLEERYTLWNLLAQGLVVSMAAFGANQIQIQRLLTLKTLSRSRRTLWLAIPMGCGFHALCCLAGIVIYATFANCDPLTSPIKKVTSGDQLMPYYVMSSFHNYPGVVGLCICGIFSASLSTISSAINSMTVVTMQDFLQPFYASRKISPKKTACFAKAITLFYGSLCVLLAFLVAAFDNLIQASLTVFGLLAGPVLAVFFLGMMTTRANEKGTIIGLMTSIALAAWISFGAMAAQIIPKVLPVSTEGCANKTDLLNGTYFSSGFVTSPVPVIGEVFFGNITDGMAYRSPDKPVFALYKISYMWFAPIGFVTAVVVGYVTSLLINIIKGRTQQVPLELLSPVVRWFAATGTQTSVSHLVQFTRKEPNVVTRF